VFQNGAWYVVQMKGVKGDTQPTWPAIAQQLPAHGTATNSIDLSNHEGVVPGRYRLIKEISLNLSSQMPFVLVTEFTISEASQNVSIGSTIDTYTPTMSSVPGLPLIVSVDNRFNSSNLEYIWKTEKGGFLSWSADAGFIVKNLGPGCTVSDKTIYWTPVQDSTLVNESTSVTVEVKKVGTNKILGRKSVLIDCSDGNLYSIHK
jgi:hypothetical protein